MFSICEEKNPKNRYMRIFIFWPVMDFDPTGGLVMLYQNPKNLRSRIILEWRIRI
jgi:hypothetical protein